MNLDIFLLINADQSDVRFKHDSNQQWLYKQRSIITKHYNDNLAKHHRYARTRKED